MNLMCCVFLTIMGGAMLLKPKAIWVIAESWKVKTKAEPTSLYLTLIRIAGCILILGGILVIFEI